jgi:hypothetical protein
VVTPFLEGMREGKGKERDLEKEGKRNNNSAYLYCSHRTEKSLYSSSRLLHTIIVVKISNYIEDKIPYLGWD